jgi:hypothetical protein
VAQLAVAWAIWLVSIQQNVTHNITKRQSKDWDNTANILSGDFKENVTKIVFTKAIFSKELCTANQWLTYSPVRRSALTGLKMILVLTVDVLNTSPQ